MEMEMGNGGFVELFGVGEIRPIIASISSLKGKNFTCMETSVKLSPCPSSVKALALSYLYGKVIAPMIVDIPIVLEFVAKTWKKPVSVVAMVDDVKTSNVFKFGFDNGNDRNWALANGPWCVRGYTLALQDWTPSVDGPIVFNSLRVWVQVHNLPHEFYSSDNGFLLGGLVGSVIKLDMEEDKPTSWTTFFKILVDIDIHKPLFSGCFFDLNSGVKQWLQVKFEKIGIFCYHCGRLGHQRRGCSLSSPMTVAKCDGIPFPMYGPWLSTSSAYHDVFSGPSYGGPSTDSSFGVVKKSGAYRPLMASPTPVAGESMGVTGMVRRPRRSMMVTHRAAAKSWELQRLVWHPKQSAVGGKDTFATSGNRGDIGVRMQGKDLSPSVEGRDIFLNSNDVVVDLSSLDGGSSPCGPGLKLLGPAEELLDCGPKILNQDISHPSGSIQQVVPFLISGGPVLEESNLNNISNVGHVDPIVSNPTPTIIGPVLLDQANGGQVGLTSSKPVGVCENQVQINEEQALSHFFKAQEELMNDLKHFGKLDLYEIRKIGGDTGVPASSEVNERTTPFKKRKFISSASLCSRPHKIHRKYPGVVRDFPWDTKQKENDPDMVLEEPSEDSSNSPSRFGILKNPLIGSFVIDDAVSKSTSSPFTSGAPLQHMPQPAEELGTDNTI
ncbi:hypothetical protein G4B88_005131 [Cannabis sativa]|uniref:CCHC-type domain-containing protein n=1 Tax=Cannabis sativa TaxID=3483 RepID=A0A7J6ESG6_CANSA|nr:hypothetical protein G4B88_005131 [Cannabis sativa]